MLDDVDTGCPVNWSHPLNRGRVAWWLALPHSGFRGNTWRDLVGLSGRNANHGTLTNGPVWRGPKGRPGGQGGLTFDGSDDFVSVPHVNALSGTSQFSLGLWVRYDTLADLKECLSQFGSGTNSGVGLLSSSLGAGGDNTTLIFGVQGGGTDAYGRTATGALAAGVWNYFVAVYDGSQSGNASRAKLYQNGVARTLTFTGAIPATSATTTVPFRVSGIDGDTRNFTGAADDVSVWSRALSAAEVAEDYRLSRLGYPDVLNRN